MTSRLLPHQGQGPVAQFQTKCCNNLAIDYADQNYFASSALDIPGVMIWDRRATSRHNANQSYTNALEQDGLPWGGALWLDRAVQNEINPSDSGDSFIRALRFCRDQAGLLGVLSRTGQLRVLSTRQEYFEEDVKVDGSPELLEVRRSYELDPLYAEANRKNDKIISFDWITLSSPVLQPRALVLRANGALDVLQKPSFTSEHPFQLIPWQPPHRGQADGTDYQELMNFESPHALDIFGPFLTEQALSDIPLFGPQKANVKSLVEQSLTNVPPDGRLVTEESKSSPSLLFEDASPIADKLKALRLASKQGKEQPDEALLSQLEQHEKLLTETRDMSGLSSKERFALDHTMLLRAQEGYRFDFVKNQKIVADDPWLMDVWAWAAGAEAAAADGGMISHPLDLGYMGVHSVWTNDLVETKRLHHREMCLEICGLGRPYDEEFKQAMSMSGPGRESTWYTMVAAHAVFRGEVKRAVQVLKKASSENPELLFVSLALQLIDKNGDDVKTALDFDESVACKTDPYLRAISAIIATGNWAEIADQKSLPLRDRCFVAVRYFSDDALTAWLDQEVAAAIDTGDIKGIILTGLTDPLVDILARYVHKFNDTQTAALLLSTCAPRFIDDIRATAMRNAYRHYLQRHRAFFFRAKFDVESTLRSKHHGRPTVPPPSRQIGLRCVYCDAEFKAEALSPPHTATATTTTTTSSTAIPPPLRTGSSGMGMGGFKPTPTGTGNGGTTTTGTTTAVPTPTSTPAPTPRTEARAHQQQANPYTEKMVASGISCPSCKQHLPRCVVCLEVVGMSRSAVGAGGSGGSGSGSGSGSDAEARRRTARFPTFCVACGHVLHLDHAREWFARHRECPVPECRCLCNSRINEELEYA
ncbi:hypothetical protein CHGG_05805 [Chaetomium globosum CBS 148.51]|uniref:Uncharacterized protein n=1 Tax=Chaetomium globosum (strain ATCC 6205 / CBS 148.51 / DSM 1962 / NBRC 6347 / NRRL 1970) TaxID=306901 RepID=Q2H6B0_CHAGB|nr:uncharacterized protein CHGG_05805 [Chaetomium globosum CBS 148.51]EAQ89186.1 hypothetical protein CHGG_05805 [Chaetomium globosum CBS 148.51]